MLYHYICIEGNIGAGKTTLAKNLASFTGGRLILEEFEENPFLPLFYKNPERYALQTELTFLTDRYKQLSSQLVSLSLFHPVTISDYYLYKSRLFARNNLNEDDFKLYCRIFNIVESTLPKPDIMIFLHHEPKALLSNIRDRGREYEQGITPSYLASIQHAYLNYINTETRFPILLMDMKERKFISGDHHLKELTELLGQKFPPGLTQI